MIAIISVLVSILLPALAKARKAAQATVCLSNLRQLGVTMTMYTTDWQVYPWLATPNDDYQWADQMAQYLKILDWQPEHWYLGKTRHWLRGVPRATVDRTIFTCPAESEKRPLTQNLTSYCYNMQLVSEVSPRKHVIRRIGSFRETTNLALLSCGGGIGSGSRRVIFYGLGRGSRNDSAGPWHSNGSQMLFCDGHAARIMLHLDQPVFQGTPPNQTQTGFLIDKSIQIYPDKKVYPMPRINY